MRADDAADRERRSVADTNLHLALTNLTNVSAHHLRQLVRGIEGDVVASIHSISEAAVDGLRDIKEEVSISAAVRRNPVPWVLGAAIVGGFTGYMIRKESAAKM